MAKNHYLQRYSYLCLLRALYPSLSWIECYLPKAMMHSNDFGVELEDE